MDTHECQPLYLEILEFYEGLNMKVEQQIPMLLVERQALNEAMEGEKNVTTKTNEAHSIPQLFSSKSQHALINALLLLETIGASSLARD